MSTLKEIFKIASLLDGKGLVSEADILDSAVKDYINKTAGDGDKSSNVKTTDNKILNLQTAKMKDVVRAYEEHESFAYTFRFDGFSGNFAYFYAKGIEGSDIDPNEEYHLVINNNNIPVEKIIIGENLKEYDSSMRLQNTKLEEDLEQDTTAEKYKIKNTMNLEASKRAIAEDAILKDLYSLLYKDKSYHPSQPIRGASPDSNDQIKDHKSVPITDESKLYYFDGIHGSRVGKDLYGVAQDASGSIIDLTNSYQEGLAFYNSKNKEAIYYEFASNLTLPVKKRIRGVLEELVSSEDLTSHDYQFIGVYLEKLLDTGFFAEKKEIGVGEQSDDEDPEPTTDKEGQAADSTEGKLFFLYTTSNANDNVYQIPGTEARGGTVIPGKIVYLVSYGGNHKDLEGAVGEGKNLSDKFKAAYDVTGAIIISKLSEEFKYKKVVSGYYLGGEIESFDDALVKIKTKSLERVITLPNPFPEGKYYYAKTSSSKEEYFDEYIKAYGTGKARYSVNEAGEFIKDLDIF